MTTIDLIILGILKKDSLSAYDIQKLVEYRQISQWVRISTPSIYKKVLQLEKKGYIKSVLTKSGKKMEKAVYSLTTSGEKIFDELMLDISAKPIHIFLDFNAVIVNLDNLAWEKRQLCLEQITNNIRILKERMQKNLDDKEQAKDIPAEGMSVLKQQFLLIEAIEIWLAAMRKDWQL